MSPHELSRRSFLHTAATAGTATVLAFPGVPRAAESGANPGTRVPKPTAALGSRLELFVDDFLVESWAGRASLQLNHPTPQEVGLVHDALWEGNACCNHTVFQDGRIYRLYYQAENFPYPNVPNPRRGHRICYAESDDGMHWRKPDLGLFEHGGSKANNIILPAGAIGNVKVAGACMAVFKDENPVAAVDARYKAIVRSDRSFAHGLLAFKSVDGLRWTPMADKPVITEGAFDSQNLAFWDAERAEYRCYFRVFTAGITNSKVWQPAGYRAIRTATSKDFLTWGNYADLVYEDSPDEELYTNQVKPYHRAPHLYLGFPMRYIDRGWSDSMRALPDPDHRVMRAKVHQRIGTALTEGLFMSSRDGVKFKRWNEAFVRAGIERKGTWNYAHQLVAWHVVETKSALPGAPNELSFYAPEDYWTGVGTALRRHTMRIDGFVSVSAPMSGGEFTTRPVTFTGARLHLNFSSSAAGGIQVEVQDEGGKPGPGFRLEDCSPVFGDSLERAVTWRNGDDVSSLAGKPVRLRFRLQDADLYSIRFR